MKERGVVLALLCLAAVPAMAQIPDEFKNLQVLPKDIGKHELVSEMRQFAGALGVRCAHCHLGPDNLEGMDFATDELEPKRVARAMMKMTQEINGTLLQATGRDSLLQVRCVTCHRGVLRPEQLVDLLGAVVESEGVDGAIARYRALREQYYGSGSYDFGAGTLNGLAETVAQKQGDLDGAIRVIELNIELNPKAVSSIIMLGQLHMQKGDKEAAVAAIQRAIELEPDNSFAKRMLERVQSAP